MIDLQTAVQALQNEQNILILPSHPATGDSLGSALALFLALQQKGKNVSIIFTDEIAEMYHFLPNYESIVKEAKLTTDFCISVNLDEIKIDNIEQKVEDKNLKIILTSNNGVIRPEHISFPKPDKKFDLLVVVDAVSFSQLGKFYTQNYTIFQEIPSLNIDHHTENTNFASINLVDSNSSATAQIMYELIQQLEVEIDEKMATLLLSGIITKTGSFQNKYTTPDAFDIAAQLVEKGARQQDIIKNIYKTKQLSTLKLWGKILSRVQTDELNSTLWSHVTQLDFSETNTAQKDIGTIIEELLVNAEASDRVFLLVETEDNKVQVNLRASDAVEIATELVGENYTSDLSNSHNIEFSLDDTDIATAEKNILRVIRLKTGNGRVEQLTKDFVTQSNEPNKDENFQ